MLANKMRTKPQRRISARKIKASPAIERLEEKKILKNASFNPENWFLAQKMCCKIVCFFLVKA